jgi:hypothetical protein
MKLSILFLIILPLGAGMSESTQAVDAPKPQASRLNQPFGDSGPEPSLQTILNRLGYTVDVTKDEIDAPLFLPAERGPVVHHPISAFGLLERCETGWYSVPAHRLPEKRILWSVEGPKNKQDAPPLAKGSIERFRPGGAFGLWVPTEGFKNETVYTQDRWQVFISRFPESDRHKVRVFPAKTARGTQKNAYLLCWEYSTNNDFQDIVTKLENVRPLNKAD